MDLAHPDVGHGRVAQAAVRPLGLGGAGGGGLPEDGLWLCGGGGEGGAGESCRGPHLGLGRELDGALARPRLGTPALNSVHSGPKLG